jgi:hypothetical protein
MTARGGGPAPTELRNMEPRGVPTYPSESRNGGTITYHLWQRNATRAAMRAWCDARAGELLVRSAGQAMHITGLHITSQVTGL